MKIDKKNHIQFLLNSFKQFTGEELIERNDPESDMKRIENADFVLVSHNREEDPLLNYGNKAALNLWEMKWQDFVKTPSRKTAEPELRSDRAQMLAIAMEKGYVNNYSGIRITSTGRRFRITKAIIWNVIDANGSPIAQAAFFKNWEYLGY